MDETNDCRDDVEMNLLITQVPLEGRLLFVDIFSRFVVVFVCSTA